MLSDDRGLTVVELLIAASLLLVALSMFSGSLFTSQRAQATNAAYSRANDQVQIALQSIDRQIRSGYVVGIGTLTNADAVVTIYSEASGTPRCFAWAVADADATGKSQVASLFTATWDAFTGTQPAFTIGGGGGWVRMATDLWNWRVSPQIAPFTVQSASAGVLKTLDVAFRLNATDRSAATVEVASSFTSRNLERSVAASGSTC